MIPDVQLNKTELFGTLSVSFVPDTRQSQSNSILGISGMVCCEHDLSLKFRKRKSDCFDISLLCHLSSSAGHILSVSTYKQMAVSSIELNITTEK